LAIWAAVVGDPDQPLPASELRAQLRAQLRERLDGIEIPRRVLVVDALPRTPSGKLPSQAIATLFSNHDRQQANVQLPV
jgi:acyl-coenzyme A synthetase/AMP-(fatty) acid ligase